jgi:hypothetical protein
MVQITKRQKTLTITLVIFLAGFFIFRYVGQNLVPSLMFAKHTQTVAFSHVIHRDDVGIPCDNCHFFYDDGDWSGTPSIEVCAECHEEIIGESRAEERLVNDYIEKGKEIEWALYFRQPQCVSFSHSSHVRRAKLECETCHGPQGLSRHATEYRVNRITKYSYVVYDPDESESVAEITKKNGKGTWGTMSMDECAECHRSMGTSTACFICHK